MKYALNAEAIAKGEVAERVATITADPDGTRCYPYAYGHLGALLDHLITKGYIKKAGLEYLADMMDRQTKRFHDEMGRQPRDGRHDVGLEEIVEG